MQDKEKTMVEQIKGLPPELQDKFVDMATGAALALETLKKEAGK